MALIMCPKCQKQISDKASHCVHCGNLVNLENDKEVTKVQKKKLNTKIIVLVTLVFSSLIVILSVATNMQKGNVVNDELDFIENLFPLSRQEILSRNSNIKPEDSDEDGDLIFEGTFAGIEGKYMICISDGEVWRIIFERNIEEINAYETVDLINDALGEYIEYDSKWNKYEWKTDNLEIVFYVDERTYIDWIGESY